MNQDIQAATLERFYDAISSMEAQLIALYEEKTLAGDRGQNGEEEKAKILQMVEELSESVIQIKSERDTLKTECHELRERVANLGESISSGVQGEDTSKLLLQLEDLKTENTSLQLQLTQSHTKNAGASEGNAEEGNGVSLKVMRKNMELSSLNEEMKSQISSIKLELDEARSEIQRVLASNEKDTLVAKKELTEELQKTRAELTQQKQRFREVGASIMEQFFGE
jgi:hypothetical protein